jgi:hypothetical protein
VLTEEFERQWGQGQSEIFAWIVIFTSAKQERLMYFRGIIAKDGHRYAKFTAEPPVTEEMCRNPKQYRGPFVLGIKPDGEVPHKIKVLKTDKTFGQLLDLALFHTLHVDPIVFFYLGRSLRIGKICHVLSDHNSVTCELSFLRTLKCTRDSGPVLESPLKRPRNALHEPMDERQDAAAALPTNREVNNREEEISASNPGLPDDRQEMSTSDELRPAALAPSNESLHMPRCAQGRGRFQSPLRDPVKIDTSSIVGYIYVMQMVADDQVFYYVGASEETNNVPPTRIQAHVRGEGCSKLIPSTIPVDHRSTPKLVQLMSVATQEGMTPQHALGAAENNKVLQLFEKHGSRNVRGGVWCTVPFGARLSDGPLNLSRSLRGLDYKTGQVFGANSQS